MKKLLILLISGLLTYSYSQAQNDPIRVIVFGAHPDDCENDAGGLAALYSSMGHQVKFVSLTNGDKGHQEIGGGPLAVKRLQEAQNAGKALGIAEYEVLDNHDGELMPTLENRMDVIRLIREWNADVVIAPRPNDYHPDHRYTGVLVQDAAYMVIVPNIVPHTPPLKKNPVFIYSDDHFQRPNPLTPDIAVDISPVYEKKLDAIAAHDSQFFEWLPWTSGIDISTIPKKQPAKRKWLEEYYGRRLAINSDKRKALEKWYGKQKGSAITKAEFFQICEYGQQPDEAMLRRLFPMLPSVSN